MTADKWADVAAEKWEHQSNVPLDDAIEYIIEEVVTSAVAEETAKRTCVGHGRTLCACYGCIQDFKAEAVAEERERCAKVAEESLALGYRINNQIAAAIRKEVKP